MTDRLEKLESELAAMRPCALPSGLENRIANAITAKRPWADRCLMSAMTMGAMAACMIVSVLVRGGAMNSYPAPTVTMVRDVPRFGSYPQLVANADMTAMDGLK
jgi:hypothetical protein